MKKLFFLMVVLSTAKNLTAQNVGIGTTTPSKPFTVTAFGIGISQESSPGGVEVGFYTAPGGAYVQTHSNDDLNFATNNGVSRVVLKTNGNFGIRNSTPNASLSVGRGTGNDGTAAFFGTTHTSHFNFSTNEDTYIRAGKDNSNVIINDIPGGRIGIGMTTPRVALEQNGVVGYTSAIFGGEGAGISLQRNWPGVGFNQWHDGSDHRTIAPGYSAQFALNQGNGSMYYTSWDQNSATTNGLLLGTNQYTRFFISRFGKLGIGTDNPQTDIEIVGSGNLSTLANEGLRMTNPSGGSWTIVAYPSLLFNYFNFNFNGNNKAQISANDGTYYSLSDANLKKNITYLNDKGILGKVLSLAPVTYLMKDEQAESKYHLGFISQEVEKIFPEVVAETKGIKMMNYSGLIPVAVQAIKEQQQQIETLQKENADLKTRISRMEKLLFKQ